jgi:hypothetical protein
MPSLRAVMVHGGGEKDGGGSTDGVPPPCAHTLVSLLRARSQRSAKADEKVEWVRSQLVGSDAEFETPFGRRALLYADHTASGRSLRYIEDYIVKHVLPFYGQWCSGAPYSFRMQHRCMHACIGRPPSTTACCMRLDRSTHTH